MRNYLRFSLATLIAIYSLSFFSQTAVADVCANDNPGTAKTVAVLGFGLANPNQANWGNLSAIEQGAPQLLVNFMQAQGKHEVIDSSYQVFDLEGSVSQPALNISRMALPDSQYLIIGRIQNLGLTEKEPVPNPLRTMSLKDLKTWSKSLIAPVKGKHRRFALEINLVNRYTGQVHWRDQIALTGHWTRPDLEKTGWSNPLLWRTDWGEKVLAQIEQSADRLNEQLLCEPFITRVRAAYAQGLEVDTPSQASFTDAVGMDVLKPADITAEQPNYHHLPVTGRGGDKSLAVYQTGPGRLWVKLFNPGAWNIRAGDLVELKPQS